MARDVSALALERDRPVASLVGSLDTNRKNGGVKAISYARRYGAGAVRALGAVGAEEECAVNSVTKCLVVQLVRDDEHRTWTHGSKRSRHSSEQGARKDT